MGRPKDLEKHRYWGAQIRAWERSGLTQAEFCRREKLGMRLFGSWKRRLGGRRLPGEPRAQFVAVAVCPERRETTALPVPPPTSLTVVTGTGYRVEVGDGFAPQTLARLLATLERL